MSEHLEPSHDTSDESAKPILVTFHEIAETQDPDRSLIDNATALLKLTLTKHTELSASPAPNPVTDLREVVQFAHFLTTTPTEEDLIHLEMLKDVVDHVSLTAPTPMAIAQKITKIAWQNKATTPLVLASYIWVFDQYAERSSLPTSFHTHRHRTLPRQEGYSIVRY